MKKLVFAFVAMAALTVVSCKKADKGGAADSAKADSAVVDSAKADTAKADTAKADTAKADTAVVK